MAKIWLRGDFLLNAQLPLCPPHRIITFNIAKMVAYAKSKAANNYPDMTLESWMYLAISKLQICKELAEAYFNIAYDVCKSAGISTTGANDSDQKRKKVPLLGFAVFLFMQQANRLNLRASMSGLERRPRTYSERDGSNRSRRSSLGGSLGQENIESRVTDFLLANLQSMLELLAVYDGVVKDYHIPKTKQDFLSLASLKALDLILEGHNTAETMSVLQFSTIVEAECDGLGLGTIRIRSVENFIRKNLQGDPYVVATLFSDSPLISANENAALFGTNGSISLKRSNSENGFSSNSHGLKSVELTNHHGTRIMHNAKTAPQSHRVIMANSIHRQTVGKISDLFTNAVLHLAKNCQSHIYLLSPFKTSVIHRCKSSLIVLGPTAGVIRMQNCYDCTLVVICRRLIISDCQRCTVYLKTPSNPLILGSTNSELTLAPYCSWYGDLDNQMAQAGIMTKPDYWNQPLTYGNGNPKAGIDGPVASAWRAMDPRDFYPVSIPFIVPGSTKTIPGGLPSLYKKALEERQVFFNDWNKFSNELEEDERKFVKELVEKEYALWLEKTGRMEELQQLRMLEAHQRKRQTKK